ncbi:hypothetical protein Tco_0477964 [Tanacetum coccineum]
MKSGFLDSRGGGGKKKQSNNNVSFGPWLDYGSTSLMDATGTIHMGTGSVNNSGNGGNSDGVLANVGHTCPNSTSEGVVPISTPNPGNGIDVVVSMESIRAMSERFANTAYGFFLGKRWPTLLSSYVRAMIKLQADVELKDNIVVVMPKITREGFYTCNIRVEYEWKPPRCACCKVFGHVQEECPKNIDAGETNNLKKPSQLLKVFRLARSSPSTTSIIEKIDKIEKIIIDGKVTLVDNEGKPLKRVVSSGDYDSEDEVASADNEMASFLAKKDGYGQEIPDKLQAICDNLDIKVRGCSSLMVLVSSYVFVRLMTWRGGDAHISGTCTYVADDFEQPCYDVPWFVSWFVFIEVSREGYVEVATEILCMDTTYSQEEAVCSHLDGFELGRYYGVFLWL